MTDLSEKRQHRARVVVMRRNCPTVAGVRALREGSTGRLVACVPRIWATAAARPQRCSGDRRAHFVSAKAAQEPITSASPGAAESPKPELAFYRKYTEALLRRYLRLSLEAGRVPSLIGREMFRGNVTHYRVHNFEDVVIFCHDVEKRLGQLSPLDQQLVKRIGLQQYTQGEAAGMLGISLRHCVRLYAEMLDHLTELLLQDRLLEPQNCCQGG